MAHELDLNPSDTVLEGWRVAFLIGPPGIIPADPNALDQLPGRVELATRELGYGICQLALGDIGDPRGVIVAFGHPGPEATQPFAVEQATVFAESLHATEYALTGTLSLRIKAARLGINQLFGAFSSSADKLFEIMPHYDKQLLELQTQKDKFWNSTIWHQLFDETNAPIDVSTR